MMRVSAIVGALALALMPMPAAAQPAPAAAPLGEVSFANSGNPAAQAPFLRGVASAMEEAPNGLLLLPDSRFREEAARTVREAAVDGFIVYSAPQNDPRV
jgi:DNA-binding LacI/PurR family transcriptional regulator